MDFFIIRSLESRDIRYIRKQPCCSCSSCSKPAEERRRDTNSSVIELSVIPPLANFLFLLACQREADLTERLTIK